MRLTATIDYGSVPEDINGYFLKKYLFILKWSIIESEGVFDRHDHLLVKPGAMAVVCETPLDIEATEWLNYLLRQIPFLSFFETENVLSFIQNYNCLYQQSKAEIHFEMNFFSLQNCYFSFIYLSNFPGFLFDIHKITDEQIQIMQILSLL